MIEGGKLCLRLHSREICQHLEFGKYTKYGILLFVGGRMKPIIFVGRFRGSRPSANDGGDRA